MILLDGREGRFPHYVLDHLIRKKGIIAFQRSDGWVRIGVDPIRKAPTSCNFSGEKKRFTDFLVKKRTTDWIA
ncbi:GSU3473 family protein [Geomonas sp.]|uniref:GSU3473 family protein n=1 Tax=Geomonas sp. TaxID=2651584 RepID=UPI0032C2265F